VEQKTIDLQEQQEQSQSQESQESPKFEARPNVWVGLNGARYKAWKLDCGDLTVCPVYMTVVNFEFDDPPLYTLWIYKDNMCVGEWYETRIEAINRLCELFNPRDVMTIAPKLYS